MSKTKEQLITENKELQSSLTEVEEALIAIRNGEVDAIVISGKKGEQVYSISSAETPYRTFVEEMNEGAVTLSKEAIIIYCNLRFAELAGEPIERVIGSSFKRFITSNDKSKFEKLYVQLTYNKTIVLNISLINSIYLKLSFKLLPAYLQGDYCIAVATDVSQLRKEEKKLLELNRLLEQKVDVIQRLRMQLIDKKIDYEVQLKKSKITNSKLHNEIARHKLTEAELNKKLKQKKTNKNN